MGISVVTPGTSLPNVASVSNAALAAAEAGTESGIPVAGGDFAALLFGQLFGEGISNKAPGLSTLGRDEEAPGEDTSIPTDGSQLLATLGLLTPEVTRADVKTAEAANTGPGAGTTAVTTGGKGQEIRSGAATEAEGGTAKIAASSADSLRADAMLANAAKDSVAPTAGSPTHAAHAPAVASSNDGTQAIATPVRDRAWGAEFAQKVVWLASNDKQSAQLTLNPPQMGPIEISLNLNKDTATAVFVSPNAEIRDAIETALPKLREMLAGVGIELGQANVSSESFRQQNTPEEGSGGTNRWRDDTAILAADTGGSTRSTSKLGGLGLVDTFA